MAPKIIAGLGNPGNEYRATRHNVGFMAVDALARRLNLDRWKTKDGARQAYDAALGVVLLQPQTFMNNSGAPVRIIASWYRTPPEDVLVLYDDMDLPFGKLRMRPFGGHGGHNGMRSLIATMTDRFARLRIGIGRPENEGIEHVLSPFDKAERDVLPGVIDTAAEGAEIWLRDGIDAAMRFVNAADSDSATNRER